MQQGEEWPVFRGSERGAEGRPGSAKCACARVAGRCGVPGLGGLRHPASEGGRGGAGVFSGVLDPAPSPPSPASSPPSPAPLAAGSTLRGALTSAAAAPPVGWDFLLLCRRRCRRRRGSSAASSPPRQPRHDPAGPARQALGRDAAARRPGCPAAPGRASNPPSTSQWPRPPRCWSAPAPCSSCSRESAASPGTQGPQPGQKGLGLGTGTRRSSEGWPGQGWHQGFRHCESLPWAEAEAVSVLFLGHQGKVSPVCGDTNARWAPSECARQALGVKHWAWTGECAVGAQGVAAACPFPQSSGGDVGCPEPPSLPSRS